MGYVLITGASEGIGKAIARRAAKDGRDLILSARSEDKLNALADELRQGGQNVHVVVADLNAPDEAKRLWAEAAQIGPIEVLVNNAGLGINGPFAKTDADREETSVQVNMVALTKLMKAGVQHMTGNGGGKILNVSSTAAFMPGPHMAVYHASKAYVLSLSEAVAQELAGAGITVSVLCPGPTKTDFFKDADMKDVRLLKLGLSMSAEDVADAGWSGMMRGKRVIVPGFMNKVFAFMPRITPRGLLTWVVAQFYVRS
ncbi:SDR family NAD(P)-dependent oxidoreductase [Litoreibacter arenae]|uniref:Short-chain dehydrogenase n=1 Tax=Litoreibacter arenae DSM 19593 TaxID=1123360 RepID=S9QK97_9RHOB|nr:SDR family oxidoreductase [Litoreibacter arenae]EPX80197.1 short-chain dehydrogenase [Litoreibacter arenae DSM 19593]